MLDHIWEMHAERFQEVQEKCLYLWHFTVSLTSFLGLQKTCVLLFDTSVSFFFGLGVEQGFLWGRFLLSWCSKYSHAGINFLSFPYMTVRLLQPPLPLDITLPGIR